MITSQQRHESGCTDVCGVNRAETLLWIAGRRNLPETRLGIMKDCMAASALTEKLSAAGEPGQYGGAETVLRFSDPRAEFSALRSACGVYHLSWRSRILVQGKDRLRWMNNMVTNNVRDLPSGRGVYSFVLNVQGRIL